jgi:hypothetical protein
VSRRLNKGGLNTSFLWNNSPLDAAAEVNTPTAIFAVVPALFPDRYPGIVAYTAIRPPE